MIINKTFRNPDSAVICCNFNIIHMIMIQSCHALGVGSNGAVYRIILQRPALWNCLWRGNINGHLHLESSRVNQQAA